MTTRSSLTDGPSDSGGGDFHGLATAPRWGRAKPRPGLASLNSSVIFHIRYYSKKLLCSRSKKIPEDSYNETLGTVWGVLAFNRRYFRYTAATRRALSLAWYSGNQDWFRRFPGVARDHLVSGPTERRRIRIRKTPWWWRRLYWTTSSHFLVYLWPPCLPSVVSAETFSWLQTAKISCSAKNVKQANKSKLSLNLFNKPLRLAYPSLPNFVKNLWLAGAPRRRPGLTKLAIQDWWIGRYTQSPPGRVRQT